MGQRALLFILTNVAETDESDFNRWYDREHLIDRVDLPGMTAARRYAAIDAALWKYLAVYEAQGIGTFVSDAYKQRLGSQSPWSKRVLPTFVDPQRTIAAEVVRRGCGFGGCLAIAALRPALGQERSFAERFAERAETAIADDHALFSMRLLAGDPELSRPVAEYKPSRPLPIGGDDWFAVAEATDAASLKGFSNLVASLPSARTAVPIGIFGLRIGVDPGEAHAS